MMHRMYGGPSIHFLQGPGEEMTSLQIQYQCRQAVHFRCLQSLVGDFKACLCKMSTLCMTRSCLVQKLLWLLFPPSFIT